MKNNNNWESLLFGPKSYTEIPRSLSNISKYVTGKLMINVFSWKHICIFDGIIMLYNEKML